MAPLRLTIFLSLLLGACAQRGEEGRDTPASPEEAGLRKILESYYADMSARDWRKFRGYFWDNATITTAWQQPPDSVEKVHVVTIDDFIAKTPEGPDSQPVFSERMKGASISVKDNLGSAWVDYDAEFGQPDSLMRWSGTDVFTFLKHAGEWRIVALVFESD